MSSLDLEREVASELLLEKVDPKGWRRPEATATGESQNCGPWGLVQSMAYRD